LSISSLTIRPLVSKNEYDIYYRLSANAFAPQASEENGNYSGTPPTPQRLRRFASGLVGGEESEYHLMSFVLSRTSPNFQERVRYFCKSIELVLL